MQSKALNVEQYLNELPPERAAALRAVREVILENLDRGYEEGMLYGMIGYYVPHRIYPRGYHCDPRIPLPFAGLASQKNYMSLYVTTAYDQGREAAWLRAEWSKAGKKLDMGKCCIRFKKLDDLPLDVVGEAIRRVPVQAHIEFYENAILPINKRAAAKAAKAKAEAGAKSAPKAATAKKKATRPKSSRASARAR